MKETGKKSGLSLEQRRLLQETMKRMDTQYDEACHMLGNKREGHGVRVSAHYAVGLLARGGAQDKKRAADILDTLLKMQYRAGSEDAFYGGFPRNDREKQPPREPFPGADFNACSRYYMEKWQETIVEKFGRGLLSCGYGREDKDRILNSYWQAVTDTVPVVWKGFDPNWREFIGTDIVMILAFFEEDIEEALVGRLKIALEKAAAGSVTRYRNHVCPMNTNIELMHILICAFLGERFRDEEMLKQALSAAKQFEVRYREFHSVGEYNSTTYYSVDLMALAAWRRILQTPWLRELGAWLEAQIWKDIAMMYQPLLKNLCGPFSRSYEMDMSIHSLLPALLYLGLGEKHVQMPEFNCELAGNVAIALLGTRIPEECREPLTRFTGERQLETRFRELMERSHPNDDTSVCTATAWIARGYMLGALRGSRNTSGQLRSATAFWKAADDSVSNLALLRREPGEECEHLRTVYFENTVLKNHMEINVKWDLERDLELVFAIMGNGLTEDMFMEDKWRLPGMTIRVEDGGMTREIRRVSGGAEIIYSLPWNTEREKKAEFVLDFIPDEQEEAKK